MKTTQTEQTALNGICPYFTMFPLEFPLGILSRRAEKSDLVLDPFCGRGTTNYAARILGLDSLGIDASPVAMAITASKLVITDVESIMAEARTILADGQSHRIPQGVFWKTAYHPSVLASLCRFRESLLKKCSSPARIALRGIILGAIHGPIQKTFPSYFSNQCPRTYAPKPRYAVQYWCARRLAPPKVDVLAIIERRAKRYYSTSLKTTGSFRLADSRHQKALLPKNPDKRFNWIITSPPYYGMRTYVPDQWLRNWFLGGPNTVDYDNRRQVVHKSPDDFAADLRKVWRNVAHVSAADATMVIRFGGIHDRRVRPLDVIKNSLHESGWRITTVHEAGSARKGKRQADAFLRVKTNPMAEYDVWATRSKQLQP